jgi:branched-chain amino acid transport system ATP-binding protein
VLKINKVNTYYGSLHILKDVSLEVSSGEMVTVIGANGAGKTTLLRTISGIVVPTRGDIELDGERINGLEPAKIVRYGICQIPEGGQLFNVMTVKENLEMGAYLRKDKIGIDRDLERMYDHFPILKERAKQQAGTLSGGQQQMLAIARGLMSDPKILILDEPSWGLAPVLVDEVADIISEIRSRGITILLNEQNASMALRLADRGYVMELGRIVMEGTGDDLLQDDGVRKAYLGL